MAPRRTIVVVPFGDVDAASLGCLAAPVSATFGAELVVTGELAVPRIAYNPDRDQFLARFFLDALEANRPRGTDRMLGVAKVDLYAAGLNFVFGEADPRRRLAVLSTARFAAEDTRTFEDVLMTEAIHELGHTYGLRHCADPRCAMWFSNTLDESRAKGHAFCAKHAAELGRRAA